MDLGKIGTEHPELKGTFIEELFTTLQAGNFVDIKHEPRQGEEVAGTMNDMERALYSMLERYCEREKKLVDRLNGRSKPFSSDELPGLRRDLATTRLRCDTSREMLWNSVKERFQDQNPANSTGWGVRSDFCIVHMFESDRPSILSLLL